MSKYAFIKKDEESHRVSLCEASLDISQKAVMVDLNNILQVMIRSDGAIVAHDKNGGWDIVGQVKMEEEK